jgi:hypothetical protein
MTAPRGTQSSYATSCVYSFLIFNYVLCIMYYDLCIMIYVLCIMYYDLCIMYYVLCIMISSISTKFN